MAGPIGLQHLVEAITSSVIKAQDELELYQLASLRRYFDEDQRPRQLSMVLPSLSQTRDDDITLKVPWLALIRPNQLAIKDLKVDMEVNLVDFDPQPEGPPPEAPADGSLPSRNQGGTLQIDVTSVSRSENRNTAKLVLSVEGQEPSEGLARTILELVKRIREEEE